MELIDRQAAKDALANLVPYAICDVETESYTNGLTDAYNLICQLPSAQPERKLGRWVLDNNPHDGDCRCSVCGIAIDQMHEKHHGLLNALTGGKWWTFYKFCPNCGADMRGEANERRSHLTLTAQLSAEMQIFHF